MPRHAKRQGSHAPVFASFNAGLIGQRHPHDLDGRNADTWANLNNARRNEVTFVPFALLFSLVLQAFQEGIAEDACVPVLGLERRASIASIMSRLRSWSPRCESPIRPGAPIAAIAAWRTSLACFGSLSFLSTASSSD